MIINKSRNALELNLLLLCLRIYLNTEAPEHLTEYIRYNRNKLRWTMFYELSVIHRVYPVVLKVIKQNPNAGVPDAIIAQLEQQRAAGLKESMMLAAETVRVARLLETNGIPVIVLKGVALAIKLYDNIGMRPTRDVDLLVSNTMAPKALKVMQTNCYQPKIGVFSSSNTSRQQQSLFEFFHHEEFLSAGLIVEIHWQLKQHSNQQTDFERISDSATTFTLSEQILNTLDSQELFNYLTTHGAIHGWCRLRWLLDIALLAQRFPDSICATSESSNYGIQAAILAKELLNITVGNINSSPPSRQQSHMAGKAASYFTNYSGSNPKHLSPEYFRRMDYLLTVVLNRNYLHNFYRLFLAPNIADFQTVSLPDNLFWLYYPLKPFLWAIRIITSLTYRNNRTFQ